VTKTDIVGKVADDFKVTKRDAQEMVESVFSILKETLESGEDVKISGFGKFEVKQKNDRRGRNPQTGATITIAARKVLAFKPSAVLRDGVNTDLAKTK
jgi:integration host factor subunit alpha